MFDIKGKVALITGGARGIGFSIAKELLKNQIKGVALIDIDAKNGQLAVEELSAKFSKDSVIFINADVTQRSQFEDAFEKTIKKFNQLDIVVNNAGIVNEVQWEKCISVNLQGCITGSLLAIDKYFPKTLGESEGLILNVASVWGFIPVECSPVYSATKHGVIGFSRSLSGPRRCNNLKIKIVTICPGVTESSIIGLTTDQISAQGLNIFNEWIATHPAQTTEQLADNVMSIMKICETGSVWVINNNTHHELKFPTLYNIEKK